MTGSGGITPPFLTSALDEDEWSPVRSGALYPGKDPPVHTEEKSALVKKPAWLLWNTEKSLGSAGNRTHAVQHVARLYIDWAAPTVKSADETQNMCSGPHLSKC
jgi:hypothetical protein